MKVSARLPLILKKADAVTICRIGLSEQLAVLYSDLRGGALPHFVLVQHRHANLYAILSDLKRLLHLVENWLLARYCTSLGIMRLQIVM